MSYYDYTQVEKLGQQFDLTRLGQQFDLTKKKTLPKLI